MEENTNVFLGTERVGKLMRGYAVPCIISLLVGALYNIVDQIFIANADYLGSYGNAANTVVFPLTVAALAIAVMVGDGCCAYVSINLGKKDVKTAKKSVGNAVVLVLLASAALTAVYLLLAEPILTMFGGRVNVETFRYAKEYFFYIALGVPFYMFGQALNPIIRADGSPKFAMASTLAGAILNTILDPVFIFVFDMGVAGAAIATVIGQICGMLLAAYFNVKKNTDITLRVKGFRPDWRLIGSIYAIGLPSVIMMAIGSVMTFLMNKILITYHSAHETAATAFGIYFKLNSFIFMPVFGLNNGVVPIIAYNYGAQNRSRMVEAIKRSAIYASIIMLLGIALFQAIPGTLLKIFDATDTMLTVGIPALRIISLSFWIAGACIALGGSFQALGKSMYSMVVSIIRQLVFLIPIAYVLARYGQSIGNDDLVWWCFPLAEVASLFVTLAFFRRLYRTLISKIPEHGTKDGGEESLLG